MLPTKQRDKPKVTKALNTTIVLVLSLLSTSCLGQKEFTLWLNPQDVYSYTYDQLFQTTASAKDSFTLTSLSQGFHINYYKILFFGDLVQTPTTPTSPASSLSSSTNSSPSNKAQDQTSLVTLNNPVQLLSCNRVRWLTAESASTCCGSSIRTLTLDTTKKSITYSSTGFPLIVGTDAKHLTDYQTVIFQNSNTTQRLPP